MKNVTIIGCGWLGLPLGKALIEAGYKVAGSVRRNEALKTLSTAGIRGFMLNLNEEAEIPEKIADSTEILIFTIPPVDRKIPDRYGLSIAKITGQFPSLKHLIFTSSSGIYPQRSGEYAEDFSFLEIEKAINVLFKAEQAILQSKADIKTILRPAGLFGPCRHPVLHLAGRNNVQHPSGHVNLVHQQDVIRAIFHCIDKAELASGIFNLAYPDHPWRKVYYTKLYRQHDLPAIGFETSSTIDRMIPGDKISEILGFRYEHPINELDDVLAKYL